MKRAQRVFIGVSVLLYVASPWLVLWVTGSREEALLWLWSCALTVVGVVAVSWWVYALHRLGDASWRKGGK